MNLVFSLLLAQVLFLAGIKETSSKVRSLLFFSFCLFVCFSFITKFLFLGYIMLSLPPNLMNLIIMIIMIIMKKPLNLGLVMIIFVTDPLQNNRCVSALLLPDIVHMDAGGGIAFVP